MNPHERARHALGDNHPLLEKLADSYRQLSLSGITQPRVRIGSMCDPHYLRTSLPSRHPAGLLNWKPARTRFSLLRRILSV